MAIPIEKTLISTPTSGDGSLNLCDALDLFDWIPDLPLGWRTSTVGALNAGKSFRILALQVEAAGSYSLGAGLCGPAYAIKFETEGEVDGDTLTLDIDEDETLGGFYLGAGLEAGLELKASIYKLGWKGGTWSAILNIELEASLDVLKAAIDIIAALLQVEDLIAQAAVEQATSTPLQMIGQAGDVYATSNGEIDLHCKISLPINLWSLCVIAAAATVEVPFINVASAAILAIHEALDVTLSSIGFGPSIGLDVPVNIQIKSVSIDDVEFEQTAITDEGQWQGSKKDASAEVADDPEKIEFTLEHQPYLDFTLGLFAEIQLMEIFHIGAAAEFDVLGIFNFQPKFTGPFTRTLENEIGREYVSSKTDKSEMFKKAGLVDVEFV